MVCHLIALRAGAVEQAAAAEALEAGPRLLLLPPRLGEPQLLGLARAGPGRTVAAARVAEARGHVLGLCELAHGRHEGGGGAEQGEGQVGGPAAPHRLCNTEGLARTGDISTYLHRWWMEADCDHNENTSSFVLPLYGGGVLPRVASSSSADLRN